MRLLDSGFGDMEGFQDCRKMRENEGEMGRR